jgi:release factor glutamine methyltransferase
MLMSHRPRMSEDWARQLKTWHDENYAHDQKREAIDVTHFGRRFVVPPEVYPPNPLGLGEAVLAEVRETDRVLDLGTGSGVNAILAASKAADTVATDVNPHAVACARDNARLNGVTLDVVESDVFEHVQGRFDLIIFDPPYRWFSPRDIRERGTADEDYEALTSFFREVHEYLADDGRILLSFGTSGDIEYVRELIAEAGLQAEELNRTDKVRDGHTVSYFTYRLTWPSSS